MGGTVKKISSERVMYLDYLRILATFAVVLIHSVYNNWETTTVYSDDWISLTIYDGLVRWSVPVFVMISGGLFLDNSKPLTNKNLYLKYTFRIVTVLIFWSVVYGIYYAYKDNVIVNVPVKVAIMNLIEKIFAGSFHLWFLFMIIGLYIITPILRKITESKRASQYFILIALIFTFIIPSIIVELNKIDNSLIKTLVANYNKMNFHLTLGYSGYFVMGHYLVKYNLSKNFRRLIYFLGVIGFAITIIMTIEVSRTNGKGITVYFDYLSTNVLFQSLAVFVFGKEVLSKIKLGEKSRKFVLAISKCSLGIYLVHILVIRTLESKGFNCLVINRYIMPLILTISVFAISLFISFILNHIPFVKKYFV